MPRSDSFEPVAQSGVCHCSAIRADLRAVCDRMFLDLAELMARVDGIPIADEPASPEEQSAAAWAWWISEQERHR
jgi:hypothetical protein